MTGSDESVSMFLLGCWMKVPSLWLIHHILDCHPVWSLSCPPSLSPLLLIGCLATRIKYRPTLSKLSILSIQSLSLFSTMLSLSPLPSPPHTPPLLSLFLLPLANSPWWGLKGFRMKKWKTFLKQHKLLLSKTISTMSHLMTQWRSLLGGCVCTLVMQRAQEVPSVHSFSLEHPLVQRDPPLLPVNAAFDLQGSGSALYYEPHLRLTTTFLFFPPYYLTNYLILRRRVETCSSFVISSFSPKAKPLRWLKTGWWTQFCVTTDTCCCGVLQSNWL